ncbi:MAG: hypothetical protein A2Z06_03520 [Candidatus Glassbacteria bacterium RBG_16_58_8]|uniref:Lipopolysaccharide assembly protein A domain-containing protein n=1 Tax=Candidatus Glassbacteria bacterium RBG_16_58_8 TaxID=1817866 RepID=A0A1F5YD26_9BACT|nr:MAG: hypothetical protein A2Z06_03520 [Candidatus Glassbacteria bacterium RBG_16_58_8]
MWVIRLLLPTLILVVIIGFAFLNPQETVNVDLFFRYYYKTPLTVVVLISILSGMLLMFSLSVYHDIKMRSQVRRLRQENRRMSEELTTLRTSPFQEVEPEEDVL